MKPAFLEIQESPVSTFISSATTVASTQEIARLMSRIKELEKMTGNMFEEHLKLVGEKEQLQQENKSLKHEVSRLEKMTESMFDEYANLCSLNPK